MGMETKYKALTGTYVTSRYKLKIINMRTSTLT